jgi:hypothetical protein
MVNYGGKKFYNIGPGLKKPWTDFQLYQEYLLSEGVEQSAGQPLPPDEYIEARCQGWLLVFWSKTVWPIDIFSNKHLAISFD